MRIRFPSKRSRDRREDIEEKRTGVVLSGGFYHGAFQIGAQSVIAEARVPVSYVVGSSVGALNGAALVLGKTDKARETWLNLSKKEIFSSSARRFVLETLRNAARRDLGPDGIFDNTPLIEIFRSYGNPKDLLASSVAFDVITANLQKRGKEVFGNRDPRVIKRPQILEDALLASSAIPIFFKPVVIGEYQYLDGGLVDNAPLSHAIRAGCDTIIFIDVSQSVDARPVPEKKKAELVPLYHGMYSIGLVVAEILTRTSLEYDFRRAHEINEDIRNFDAFRSWLIERYPAFQDRERKMFESYEKTFSFSQKKHIKVSTIKPETPLPALSPIGEVDQKAIEAMVDHGYERAKKVLRNDGIIE